MANKDEGVFNYLVDSSDDLLRVSKASNSDVLPTVGRTLKGVTDFPAFFNPGNNPLHE